MAHYNYSEEGNLDGVFVEYYKNGQVKISGVFFNNKQNKLFVLLIFFLRCLIHFRKI